MIGEEEKTADVTNYAALINLILEQSSAPTNQTEKFPALLRASKDRPFDLINSFIIEFGVK